MCILPPIICFELAIWYQLVVCCESKLAAPDSFTIIQPADAAAGFQMKVSIISWYSFFESESFDES